MKWNYMKIKSPFIDFAAICDWIIGCIRKIKYSERKKHDDDKCEHEQSQQNQRR